MVRGCEADGGDDDVRDVEFFVQHLDGLGEAVHVDNLDI